MQNSKNITNSLILKSPHSKLPPPIVTHLSQNKLWRMCFGAEQNFHVANCGPLCQKKIVTHVFWARAEKVRHNWGREFTAVFWNPKLIFVFYYSVTKQICCHIVLGNKICWKTKKLDPPKKVVLDLQKKTMGLILYGKIPMFGRIPLPKLLSIVPPIIIGGTILNNFGKWIVLRNGSFQKQKVLFATNRKNKLKINSHGCEVWYVRSPETAS